MPFIERYYKTLLVLFCTVFALQMWLCSGTLAPYAATLSNPHLINDQGDYINLEADTNLAQLGCYYIANYDHKHYIANYRLIDGKPREEWNWAHLLRRPLLYILAYPFMKMFGFLGGGFIIAVLINIAVLAWFSVWVKNRWGAAASFVGLVSLSAYPATMYWSGQPYPHILITACTLVLTILLYKIYETSSLRKIALYSLLAGISFLAYDTYIFFLPAFGLLLLWQKKWKALPVSIVLLVLPLGLWLWFLSGKTLPQASGNTDIYSNIITAYLNATGEQLWTNLKKLPGILYDNFTGALYFYLAVFFAVVVVLGRLSRSLKSELPFWVIAVAMFTVFAFNNMAPPYEGWQMRGDWIARIYQPVIILCLLPAFYAIKVWKRDNNRLFINGVVAAALLVFILNTRTNVSPALGDDSQNFRHYKFYFHAMPETMEENLEKHGRRPLWVCP
jgi:hypothetical protein